MYSNLINSRIMLVFALLVYALQLSLCESVRVAKYTASSTPGDFTALQPLAFMTSPAMYCALKCAYDDTNCVGFAYFRDTSLCQMVTGKALGNPQYTYSNTNGETLYLFPDYSTCPGKSFNEICYQIIACTTACDVTKGKQMCSDIGATLAPLRTKEIFDFIVAYKTETGLNTLLIDGTDAGDEGNWRYYDGSPMSYIVWYSGEPADSTNENTLYLHSNHVHDTTMTATYTGVVCAWEPKAG